MGSHECNFLCAAKHVKSRHMSMVW